MIEYTCIGKFDFQDEQKISDWVSFVLDQEGRELGEINYILCDDDYLQEINDRVLNHKELTDIISFDYTIGTVVSGDIYVSYQRVKENAGVLNEEFRDELHRVMIHGILHYCGYHDKSNEDKQVMRSKEDYYLSLRTF